jgi:hypothetical protein
VSQHNIYIRKWIEVLNTVQNTKRSRDNVSGRLTTTPVASENEMIEDNISEITTVPIGEEEEKERASKRIRDE